MSVISPNDLPFNSAAEKPIPRRVNDVVWPSAALAIALATVSTSLPVLTEILAAKSVAFWADSTSPNERAKRAIAGRKSSSAIAVAFERASINFSLLLT